MAESAEWLLLGLLLFLDGFRRHLFRFHPTVCLFVST
jgi:hypothetical protein